MNPTVLCITQCHQMICLTKIAAVPQKLKDISISRTLFLTPTPKAVLVEETTIKMGCYSYNSL